MTRPMPARQSRPRLAVAGGEAAILDGQWASDHWDASRLGIPARRGRGAARFDGIGQQWLRGPVKRWSRLRLATGCAFTTINAGALALTRFSRRGSPGPANPDLAGDGYRHRQTPPRPQHGYAISAIKNGRSRSVAVGREPTRT